MTDKELARLIEKIKSGEASKQEKDDYIEILYKNDKLTKREYNDYFQGYRVDEVLRTALIIGGIILLGVLISESLKK